MFADLEILEMCGQVNGEENVQEEPLTQMETQNSENQNTTEPISMTSMLTSTDRKKCRVNFKKSWLKNRLHYHPSGIKTRKKSR